MHLDSGLLQSLARVPTTVVQGILAYRASSIRLKLNDLCARSP